MNDDRDLELELASAYLDGDVSASERATVESSPELLALVAELRSLRDAVADVAPVAAERRDHAIAAALAEFDALHAAPVAPPAPSVPLAARLRWSRVLVAAAAVAVVAVVGVAALNGGNSDDSSSGAGSKQIATAEDATSAADATIGAIVGPANAIPQLDSIEQLAALPDAGIEATGGGAPESTGARTEGTDAGASVLATGDQLPTVNDMVLPPVSFAFDCPLTPTQVVLGEIRYQGAPAVAVRDTVTGVTEAIDGQCTVLASTAP